MEASSDTPDSNLAREGALAAASTEARAGHLMPGLSSRATSAALLLRGRARNTPSAAAWRRHLATERATRARGATSHRRRGPAHTPTRMRRAYKRAASAFSLGPLARRSPGLRVDRRPGRIDVVAGEGMSDGERRQVLAVGPRGRDDDRGAGRAVLAGLMVTINASQNEPGFGRNNRPHRSSGRGRRGPRLTIRPGSYALDRGAKRYLRHVTRLCGLVLGLDG